MTYAPTAVQSVGVRHEIEVKKASTSVPGMPALGITDHVEPSQLSISGFDDPASSGTAPPTAKQRVAPGHATLLRELNEVDAASGASDHFAPSQRWAIAELPTAAHWFTAGHDTPLNSLSCPLKK